MRTFTFNCENVNCESREKKLRSYKTTTGTVSRVTTDYEHVVKKEEPGIEPCPYCEEPMKLIGESLPVFQGTSLMTPNQKKDMLLKRSKAHAKTGEQRDAKSQALYNARKQYGGN